MKAVFFIILILVSAYGLQNDFALAVVAWGAAVAVAFHMADWWGWVVVGVSVLMLGVGGGWGLIGGGSDAEEYRY